MTLGPPLPAGSRTGAASAPPGPRRSGQKLRAGAEQSAAASSNGQPADRHGRRDRRPRRTPVGRAGAGGCGGAQRRRLDKLWKAKREAGYSANSIRIMRTVLRKALSQAEREGIVPRNAAALSSAPRIRAKEGRTLTVEQARRLLDTTTGHRFDVAIMITLAYGMRRGEVLGLHWSALDWEAGTLRVTHGVKRVKNRDKTSDRRTRLIVSELKTAKSRRTLVLTPEILARLRTHRSRQSEAKIAAGPLWQDHGLIFTSEVGTPMDPDNFSHTFSKLCKNAGLGHWHPHELRHSGASLMLAQGTPLHVVSEILGHTSITITKDVYGHLLEGDKRAAATSMSRALFGP